MIAFITQNPLYSLISQSDAISWLILILLLGMSTICWTLFFYKIILFRIKKRQLRLVLEAVQRITTLQELITTASGYSGTLPGYFLTKNLNFIKIPLEKNKLQGMQLITNEQWHMVQEYMYQVVDEMVYKEESYIPLFSTTAAVAPLIGLLGTVWGLINAFIGISQNQSNDISAVAPGIAQALMVTLVALLVAIPALILYNMLHARVKNMEQQLYGFVDRISFVMQRLLVQ